MKNILIATILLFIVWWLTILNSCAYYIPDVRYCYKVYTKGQVITFIADTDDIEINSTQIDSIVVKAIAWNNWKCKDNIK